MVADDGPTGRGVRATAVAGSECAGGGTAAVLLLLLVLLLGLQMQPVLMPLVLHRHRWNHLAGLQRRRVMERERERERERDTDSKW
jgi:hypothetical protein